MIMITIVCQHIMGGHKSLVARKCCQQGEGAIQALSLKVVFREFSLSGLPSALRPGKNSFLVRVLCGAPSAGWRSSAAANAKVTAAQLLLNSREAGQGRSFVRLVMKLSCVATSFPTQGNYILIISFLLHFSIVANPGFLTRNYLTKETFKVHNIIKSMVDIMQLYF